MQNWKTILQTKTLILLMFMSLSLTACTKDNPTKPEEKTIINTSFAVISDSHYFKSSLGTSGKAFEQYVVSDRKLLAESQAISESAIESLKKENVKFVLVSGDLTKDGEKESHEAFAKLLGELKATGKKVIVVPGNHDVNNPHSKKFVGNEMVPTPSVTPAEFANIYKECGYGDAIARDPNSLSYISEPVPGLWVFALDDCIYDNNVTEPTTAGRYTDATLAWIKDNLAKAKAQKKMVIGMQHHGLVEHFQGQKENPISKDYVIENWKSVAKQFIEGDMKAIFTGHFHANDITKYSVDNKDIYDIETGSLVTSPCPYRIVSMTNNSIEVTTKYIEKINYDLKSVDFKTYAADFIRLGMLPMVTHVLVNQLGVDKTQAPLIAPLAIAAFMDHYKGDEKMPEPTKNFIAKLEASGATDFKTQMIIGIFRSLYNDLNPSDNNVTLQITNTLAKQ